VWPCVATLNTTPTGNVFYCDDALVREDTTAGTIISAFGGDLLTDTLEDILSAIPADNVPGAAGISGMGSTLQATWDQLWQASSFLTGTNMPLSALASAQHGIPPSPHWSRIGANSTEPPALPRPAHH
jgi:hypothetical protein